MKEELIFSGKINKGTTSVFDFLVEGKKVGFFQLREKPSVGIGVPDFMKSHLYYEIDPKYRGQGYGTKLFTLALNKVKELGVKEVIATVMEDNILSKKILEKRGGILNEKAETKDGIMLKYKFQ